ncbi:2Fe-2S iron-sulfur cluster-binding protein [Halopseudomonas phragmitis]|uniref:Ferredoxin n=2 Tax=Pseudomonadaceae TaxID=135621 RepID=A0A1V0B359_9GAMM|nr:MULTISPECIES: 2Fe-2S iron-sulfur cluster binding domain-containing protein [Pseudomonadaceae]AQZ94357.1 ferredoxin [Halopseudomonas phragmitis]RHW21309.1 ferredoxin [Pseudomonas jilinensis]
MTDTFEMIELVKGLHFSCSREQSLLKAMELAGKRCIPVGCRGGGCGLCKVQVVSGEFSCGPMSKKHVDEQSRRCGQVLACRVYPLTDLTFEYRPAAELASTQQQVQ